MVDEPWHVCLLGVGEKQHQLIRAVSQLELLGIRDVGCEKLA